MNKFWELLLSQLLALIAFFAFPTIQYILLKISSKKEGQPELWYLPKYGFRLVIKNMHRKKILKDIKYQVKIRKIIPASKGASVKTFDEKVIIDDKSFFLFPHTDQPLLCFQLQGINERNINFVHTDKTGNIKENIPLKKFDMLICDFKATIQNLFNFNVHIAKRVKIKTSSLTELWKKIQQQNAEQKFQTYSVKNIG